MSRSLIIIAVAIFLSSLPGARACDQCGCGHGAAPPNGGAPAAGPAAPAPAAGAPAPARPAPRKPPKICPIGQTIVVLRDGVDPDEAIRALGQRYEGVVCRVYRSSIHGLTLRCTGPQVVQSLALDPLVKSLEPDVVVMALGQETPTGVRRIGAARASGAGARKGDLPGAGVGVAIVDTGIDLSHPDLDVASGVSFVEGHPSALDGQGHGTHCAGIVAARDDDVGVVGVAPGAKLYAVKVLDDDGSGSLSDVIAGLDWVTKNADRIAVANLSLGVRGQSPALRAAVQAAVHAGVVIVCAAGNDGADVFGEDGVFGTADDSIPAAFPEVCAVSAISDSDGAAGGLGGDLHGWKDDTFAAFSNYSAHPHAHPFVRSPGGAIDVAAPGVDIFSCWKDGAYRKASGTSMAAPHVTGLIARWIGQHGRDANHDGKIDEQDVYAIRQAIVDAAEPQAAWRPDGLTGDKDALHEGLAVVPGHAAAPPPNLTQRPAARPDVPRGTSPAAPDDVSRGTFPPGSIARRPASATPAAIVPAAASRRRFEPDPELGNIAGSIGVVAIIAPSAFVAEGERAGIVVGVRNHARDATSFDLVLLDADAGRGIGVKRVGALAGGDLTAVLFPVDPRTFDPRHELRAVALTPSGTSLGEMAFTPRR